MRAGTKNSQQKDNRGKVVLVLCFPFMVPDVSEVDGLDDVSKANPAQED
jgi:hypothetical protein